jgi:hypothetical protein
MTIGNLIVVGTLVGIMAVKDRVVMLVEAMRRRGVAAHIMMIDTRGRRAAARRCALAQP